MKKTIAIAIAILALATPAFATAPQDLTQDFSNYAYTVTGNSSTTAQPDYNVGDTVWLYLGVPDASPSISGWVPSKTNLTSTWIDPSSVSTPVNFTGGAGTYNTADQYWLSLGPVTAAGVWTINNISYQFMPGTGGQKQHGIYTGSAVNFNVNAPTVTPEPISMALFGLGASVLGLAGVRRRKTV